jgi:hypothetical protein
LTAALRQRRFARCGNVALQLFEAPDRLDIPASRAGLNDPAQFALHPAHVARGVLGTVVSHHAELIRFARMQRFDRRLHILNKLAQ